MAEFQDYITKQKNVRALQWDGENDTYEALIAEVPNTFTYMRPKGTLSYIEDKTKRTVIVENGQWIINDVDIKQFYIKNDNDFNATYELGSLDNAPSEDGQSYQ